MATNLFMSGSLATDDPSQIKTFYTRTSTTSRYSGFREQGTSGQYKVPADKVLHLTVAHIPESGSGSTHGVTLVGNLTDWGGFNITSAPGSVVEWFGIHGSGNQGYAALGQHGLPSGGRLPLHHINVRFTELYWPGIWNVTGGGITVCLFEGVELDA